MITNLLDFSIVIPSHNRCKQLVRALNHIAALDYPYKQIEIVVVLDGCTDNSAQMLAELCPSFPFALRYIEQSQGGPSAARNTGVLTAKSEYILFLDDDVMATHNLVKHHYQAHQENPRTIVVGTMSKPPDNEAPVWVRWEEYMLEKQYRDILNGKYQFTPRQFYTGNCSLKKEWILEAGMFDESFKRYEDVELACRLQRLGLSFKFEPRAIGYHYPNRTLKSWIKMHYLYGSYAVKIDRDKGLINMIALTQYEYSQRHWITRLFASRLLNHEKLQLLFANTFVKIAQLATKLNQNSTGIRFLSIIANTIFWQGFQDQINNLEGSETYKSLLMQ